ncbi:hypothetical protein K438DRAFT_1978624 [Mycena galopus ATCC 62051]|nr:hypothetical protein K438DRAFT_1978624 [Mycena galopus ATCC 62051]
MKAARFSRSAFSPRVLGPDQPDRPDDRSPSTKSPLFTTLASYSTHTGGNYNGAADYLYHFRVLLTDNDLNTSAQWGKLASDILSGKWDAALQELDPRLHSRTWLLHWSLFVYFNHEQGRTLLLETFLSPVYLNTIQTSCPWVLRYLAAAAAAVLGRAPPAGASSRVCNALREELYVEFDFEAAQRELGRAEHVLADDFFLGEFCADFLDNARYLINEAYCLTHQKIDIRDLSERLNLSSDEGEKWIVNLIRKSRMGTDAKIDLDKNVIEIFWPAVPVYQTVIDKARGLHLCTSGLGTAISRMGVGARKAARCKATWCSRDKEPAQTFALTLDRTMDFVSLFRVDLLSVAWIFGLRPLLVTFLYPFIDAHLALN